MMGTEEVLRLTVAALMARTGERQNDLAAGLGQSQAQVSRKQSGRAHWSLEDVDLLAAHYRLHPLDLLASPTHAAGVLHGSLSSLQPAGAPSPPAAAERPSPPAATVLDEEASTVAAVERERAGSADTLVRTTGRNPSPPVPPERPAAVPAAGPCVLCGQPAQHELDGFPQHLTAEECAAAVAAASTRRPPPRPRSRPRRRSRLLRLPSARRRRASRPRPLRLLRPSPSYRPRARPPSPRSQRRRRRGGVRPGTPPGRWWSRSPAACTTCSGDMKAARAELIKMAIADVMTLLKASRVGGRYEYSEFPPTQEILKKKSEKGADEIWEGRPKWRNPELFAAAKRGEEIEVTALDMNAAYLSAMKAWLPIGQLREDTSGVHDPKKAGVHLITPAGWDHSDLPNPLGNRMEPGELWVSESTLRLLLDCARQGLADAPVIHRSLVSGASEALLEKLRRALAESRKTALAAGDDLTVAYVKAMYSKFVSTIGESSANRELRRPDWMHIIRAKAFANLWMKAHKAHKAGLQVVEISGTDELHVVGDWRPVFPKGRELNQVKEKNTYVRGGKR
ncbi:acyltransferase [Streptomyces sp. NPDC014891]|uniref:acyltransferase n=1 Tax=Streptomyces sp. NPDC014891 TaxID=3364929 RepID=UPI0036F4CF9B